MELWPCGGKLARFSAGAGILAPSTVGCLGFCYLEEFSTYVR